MEASDYVCQAVTMQRLAHFAGSHKWSPKVCHKYWRTLVVWVGERGIHVLPMRSLIL